MVRITQAFNNSLQPFPQPFPSGTITYIHIEINNNLEIPGEVHLNAIADVAWAHNSFRMPIIINLSTKMIFQAFGNIPIHFCNQNEVFEEVQKHLAELLNK